MLYAAFKYYQQKIQGHISNLIFILFLSIKSSSQIHQLFTKDQKAPTLQGMLKFHTYFPSS